jgi:excisionase family DNA binding protein
MHSDVFIPLTIQQACAVLNCSRSRLYDLFRAGEIPVHKSGRRTIVFRHDCEKFLRSLPAANICRAA